MAVVKTFKGVLYNQERITNLSDVISPPYDVISPADQNLYYEKHPNNVVRLILPKEDESTSLGSKYETSAADLNKWISDGTLVMDSEDAFYVIRQQYTVDGVKRVRLGFTCAVRLEDYSEGTVRPHENILAKPLDDRLNMLRFTKSNYDSVFGLYSDANVQNMLTDIVQSAPNASAIDNDGVICELWKITDANIQQKIISSMADKSIMIADGHHRYAAALAYRNEMRAKTGVVDPNADYEYVMMTLVSLEDSGLIILPTHRLVRNIANFDSNKFLSQIGRNFEITESLPEKLMLDVESLFNSGHAFGLYTNGKAYTLLLKPDCDPVKIINISGSDALKNLDVTILHSLILEKHLGIGVQQMSSQSNLSYTRKASEAINMVDNGDYQMAFLMNTTRISEVKAITEAGEKMPQKSTFFYPKLLTGMVIRVMQ